MARGRRVAGGEPPPGPSHCAPDRFRRGLHRTGCLTAPELREVAGSLPAPHLPGSLPAPHHLPGSRAGELLRAVHAALGTRPGEEGRWPGLLARRPETAALGARLEAAFRPQRRFAPGEWLTSVDIDRALRQYNAPAFRGFRYVAVSPLDGEARTWRGLGPCVTPAVCALTVRGLLAQGTREFGVVFNLDPSTRGGSHWVALYGALRPRSATRFGVYYCDSVGEAPPDEIAALMERLAAEAADVFGARAAARFEVDYCRLRRQYRDAECGLYAMLFVVACLTTRLPFADVARRVFRRDEVVALLRRVFFRP